MSAIVVNCNNLSKSFKPRKKSRNEVEVVNEISFKIAEGETVAFIGPNGAGKSTTVKMLTGILRPSCGDVKVLGYIPWDQRKHLSRKIGVIFGQRSQLWYHLAPDATFDLIAAIYDLKRPSFLRRKAELVDLFEISAFLNKPVRQLSLGQRMRAEIVSSLLHHPSLLFLDEPTIGLDVVAKQTLRDAIMRWNQAEGLTTFLTSHDASDIEKIANRVIIINQGKLVFDGSVNQLKKTMSSSKRIKLTFSELPENIDSFKSSQLVFNGYEASLEIDTRYTSIDGVVKELMSNGTVKDLTIEDPPLEEIIKTAFAEQSGKK